MAPWANVLLGKPPEAGLLGCSSEYLTCPPEGLYCLSVKGSFPNLVLVNVFIWANLRRKKKSYLIILICLF